ncbi:MAG: DUF1501 domain-containing protein [SAR202 cluster bacterium]|jgi:uncharacterized protein (DUF1501 family)|nr:MAG: DUF1501 domain-containing protein [SAR202 cluster bacterium]MAR86448.1 hypothetical protein [Chloroflexota bacterium]KAA1303728.1 MAG: DUF1501 domain-containing protein [SAR202 cluster bacterium]MEC7733058.1 DUF1501 domain-containing protein [Chloroflexota bacterium]MEC8987491.1 DUF1501 domain-containing protein [Chloroflexota bacterium]|tara:strand:- start:3271 stop:4407 length:1137 start_codon:yes stop_codon:yes gene_type:complete
MTTDAREKTLVVIQLTGGNDFMNTLVPYTNEHYYDARKKIVIGQNDVLPINKTLGINNNAAPLKRLFDEGKVAIVQGIGYPNSNRSHFRGMDIWHTCEPDRVGSEGWLGLAIKDLDPKSENVLTGINIGQGLPRAMSVAGVPVTSVGDLESYGVMNKIEQERLKERSLQAFKDIYGQAIGSGQVAEYIGKTGLDVLKGADLLADVASKYQSSIEYADNSIAKSLRDVARIHFADLGTRVFYTNHGGYDTHANEMPAHPKLLTDLSGAISDFMDDLEEHNAADDVSILVFTEFGRRMRDNGSGTDHGSGGGAFLIGKNVKGGLYSEYPSLNPNDWEHGEDLKHTIDFRGIYGTVLDQWLGLDARPIVKGEFEQIKPFYI